MRTKTEYRVTVVEVWDNDENTNKVTITIALENQDGTYAGYEPATLSFYDDGLHSHYFQEYLGGLTFDFWRQSNLNTDLTKESN